MGCGVSQEAVRGEDDQQKSDAFLRLCFSEKNPLAIQLHNHFNALVSECLYKSQGNMSSYERLLRSRRTEVQVNRSKQAAFRHGIGHGPLTTDSVHDIMNLFLGHAIAALEQRKWSGDFHYNLANAAATVALETDATVAPATGSTAVESGGGGSEDVQGKPSVSLTQSPLSKKSTRATCQAASGNAAPVTLELSQESKSAARAASMSAPAAATVMRNGTLMFLDRGDGAQKSNDVNKLWRMELKGHITYTSVDGALTLICDSIVTFSFFTCDSEPRERGLVAATGTPEQAVSNKPREAAALLGD
ncbi:hypothetical protein NESM_000276000 [Novymonas esmeraldas]|uniref:Uncharacterized protein n=1 Tax=Novymonas esmeraldas TaxID=1808958 RepID=A0AAW0F7F1_9TRYP